MQLDVNRALFPFTQEHEKKIHILPETVHKHELNFFPISAWMNESNLTDDENEKGIARLT